MTLEFLVFSLNFLNALMSIPIHQTIYEHLGTCFILHLNICERDIKLQPNHHREDGEKVRERGTERGENVICCGVQLRYYGTDLMKLHLRNNNLF